MSTLPNRPNTALVVVDMQLGVVAAAHRREDVIATIAALVEKAREAGAEVIWVQHSGPELPPDSEGWPYVPELVRRDTEPLVAKEYSDAFEASTLESVLAARGIGRIFLAGAQTDECIRSTLHGGITRGYDVTLVADAHTTEDLSDYGAPPPALVVSHTNLYWQYHRAPGRAAGTVTAAEVGFATPS